MTRALRRTLRDAPIAWMLTLLVGVAAGLLRYAGLSLVMILLVGACSPPPRLPQLPLRGAESGEAIRPGTAIRVYFREPDALEPRPLISHTGKLESIGADSLTFIGPYHNERIALPLLSILRVDTAAGRRSRLRWAVLGVPLGLFGGILVFAPAGGIAALGGGMLGTLVGPVIGVANAGPRWKRVRSFRQTPSPSAAATRGTAQSH